MYILICLKTLVYNLTKFKLLILNYLVIRIKMLFLDRNLQPIRNLGLFTINI